MVPVSQDGIHLFVNAVLLIAVSRVARHFQLRLGMRNSEKPRISFDGFKRDVSGEF